LPQVLAAIQAAENQLNGNGRVNVRYSGTESLARVMVEAENDALVRRLADGIAAAIESALGAGAPAGH
jgi:phosphoglucosamine mutase